MKTHELAKALNSLAKILRKAPNQPLSDLDLNSRSFPDDKNAEIVVSLTTLATLAKHGKQEWASTILEYDLPIEIRPRDAARDVLGKILKYLEENEDERKRVMQQAEMRSSKSDELSSALRFLLKND